MDYRLEQARETLLRGVDEINKSGLQNQEALCNMEKLIQTYHYIAEIEMAEEFEPEDYERGYERSYNRNREGRRARRGYNRGYNRGYENDGDMKMFLEDSMRKATTEQERERIRRLMGDY